MKRLNIVFAIAILSSPIACPTTAQNSEKIFKIGYLSAATAKRDKKQLEAFQHGLQQLGYVIGKNYVMESRFAGGQYKKLPKLAAELVGLKVDVIVAVGPTASYAMKATKKIPIIMRQADPVGTGFVSSLARPGGNVTGMSTYNAELITKRLELLKQIVPSATRIAVLHYPRPKSSHPRQLRDLKKVAPALKIALVPVGVKGAHDLDRTLSEIGAAQIQGLIVFPSALFETFRNRIIEFVNKNRLPTIFGYDHWPKDGGLISYGTNIPALHRRLSVYVDKVLRGANPANLPVELPTQFDLAINLNTAKSIGVNFPPTILLRADIVFE